MLTEAQLSQVDNFAGTANQLAGSINELASGDAMTAGLQNITGMLGQIGEFKASDLIALAPQAQQQQARRLGDLGTQLSGAVQNEIKALEDAGSGQ